MAFWRGYENECSIPHLHGAGASYRLSPVTGAELLFQGKTVSGMRPLYGCILGRVFSTSEHQMVSPTFMDHSLILRCYACRLGNSSPSVEGIYQHKKTDYRASVRIRFTIWPFSGPRKNSELYIERR